MRIVFLFAVAMLSLAALAQPRRTVSLSGPGWLCDGEEVCVPHTWNALDGADAVRLAHYPQSRHVYDICDEKGILVWNEVPAINWLTDSPAFRSNLVQQLREMVAQKRNHPCVFAWSLFNEIYNDVSADRAQEGWMEDMLAEMRDVIKALDPTRPVVAASDRPAKRALNDIPQQLAFNAYPGWYGDTTIEEDVANWFEVSGRKILAISEYGAGGNPFEHLDPLPPGRLDPGGPVHPGETQVKLHAADYRAIASDGRIWGSFVWAMFDFAADARHRRKRHRAALRRPRRLPPRPAPQLRLLPVRLRSQEVVYDSVPPPAPNFASPATQAT